MLACVQGMLWSCEQDVYDEHESARAQRRGLHQVPRQTSQAGEPHSTSVHCTSHTPLTLICCGNPVQDLHIRGP